MTTHADHDHPNTKAGRAACRRNAAALDDSIARHPAKGKPTEKKPKATLKAVPSRRKPQDDPGDPDCEHPRTKQNTCTECGATNVLARKYPQRVEREVVSEIKTTPHLFNPHDTRPSICLNCGKPEEARIHTDGPTDLSANFGF